MTNWEADIVRRYGSLREYVHSWLSCEKPNAVKTRFDLFYKEMETLTQGGMEKCEAWFAVYKRYDIHVGTVDDYVLDVVMHSF